MKKSLGHLPRHKRDELRTVIVTIRDKVPGVEMIILFGSFARGDWVEDVYTKRGVVYEYRSDFDLLVIVETPAVANRIGFWSRAERSIDRLPLTTSVGIIAHDIDYVNDQLTNGQYFFSDVKKDGILLYDSGNYKLAPSRKLDPHERAGIAKADFKQWFTSANEFFDYCEVGLKKRWYNSAAFQLHQATERFYAAVLLVFTHYKPKGHDLKKLARRAASCDPAFLTVFPQTTEKEKECFNLLRRAYVDARYNEHYKITSRELTYLCERVTELRKLTRRICKTKIESFTSAG